jgi:hypothetical protein
MLPRSKPASRMVLHLCNCARTSLPDPARANLDGYIGHPMSELILRFGPPKVSFGVGGGKMAFQWDQSVLGQSWATASPEHQGECRLDAIIAIARPATSAPRVKACRAF